MAQPLVLAGSAALAALPPVGNYGFSSPVRRNCSPCPEGLKYSIEAIITEHSAKVNTELPQLSLFLLTPSKLFTTITTIPNKKIRCLRCTSFKLAATRITFNFIPDSDCLATG
jgi:hypothetical protein